MNKGIRWLFQQPRSVKRLISLILDTLFITLAFWAAYALRLDSLEHLSSLRHWWVLACMLPVTLLCFIRLGLYRAVLRYLAPQAIITMVIGIAVSAVAMVLAAYY